MATENSTIAEIQAEIKRLQDILESKTKGEKLEVVPVLITSDDIKKAFKRENPGATPNAWHYNGGWFKTVTGINKGKTTGYSILGEFFGSGGDSRNTPKGSVMIKPGSLILDCSTGGSRKTQISSYYLYKVEGEHSLSLVISVKGGNWATDLWPSIESNL